MAHYLVQNSAGDIKHITGKQAMVIMVKSGYRVIEMWFK
jgi:hypothetical protein